MKEYFRLFVMFFVLCFASGGCGRFSSQPLFTDIRGDDVPCIKIVEKKRTDTNEIILKFSGLATLYNVEMIYPKKELTFPCHVRPYSCTKTVATTLNKAVNEQEYSSFIITADCSIEVGEAFFVKGSVASGMHGVMDFVLHFTGANTFPAHLVMTEIRPLYGGKFKSEFIELLVTQAGNLAGITLTNVGDKNTPDYSFPPAVVSKGEVIVYHWRSVEKGLCDELTPLVVSKGVQACPAARDFWGSYTKLPRRVCNVILLKTSPHGAVMDAVAYCTKKAFEEYGASLWTPPLCHALADAAAGGKWHSCNPDSAVIASITPAKSLVKKAHTVINDFAAWHLRRSKDVTMGIAY